MKEETKFKLKKYAKRAGLGLALVSLFLLGFGVGACSARKAVGSSAEDVVTSVFGESDILRNGEYVDNYMFTWEDPSSIIFDSSFSSWLLSNSFLSAGRYCLVTDDFGGFSYLGLGFCGMGAGQALLSRQPQTLPAGVVTFTQYFTERYSFFDVTSSDLENNSFLFIRCSSSSSRLYLVTEENYYYFGPSVAQITLPTDFNPIWLYGDAYKGAVYGMLSTNADGTSYTASLDVKFVSGGNLYDGVYFEFDHLANTWYQEPTSGEIVLADRNANNYHYPTGMYYRRFGQTASVPSANPVAFDCVWSAQWALTNDGEGNTHRYLTPTGAFASDEFRFIDVKEYDASTPVSARWPNLDALALLRLKSSGFIITGETNLYDAFELLGGAFRSVSDILNIQILPFMTLGMLFFIPLIVLVLFAIIRILNK